MSNDLDVEDTDWRCGCGHSNPDFDKRCNGCSEERYPPEEEEVEMDTIPGTDIWVREDGK